MQLTARIHLVGSGAGGFGLTDRYDAHVYLLDGGDHAALVDAGCGRSVEAILERVERAGVEPARLTRLLLTHAHPDHCGGAAELTRRLPWLRVAASPAVAGWVRSGDEDAMSVAAGKRGALYPADFRARPCAVADELRDGDRFRVGALDVEVVATPGHADGHLAFVVRNGESTAVCSGDLVFYGGRVSLLNTWDCRLQAYAESMAKLRGARVDTLLPGHHGISLSGGQGHVDAANRRFDAGFVPPSVV